MLKRYLLPLFALIPMIYLENSAKAGNPFESVLEGLKNQIEQTIKGKIEGEVESKINDVTLNFLRNMARNANFSSSGFCQVWQSEKLAFQEPCRIKNYCASSGTCVRYYVWPSKRSTELTFSNGQPDRLNDFPTSSISVGSDKCYADGPDGNVFCFTAARQSPDAMRGTYAELNRSDANQSSSGGARNLEALLGEYVNATGENTDTGRARRCELGIEITASHANEIDDELRTLITDQRKADNCSS